MPFEGVVEDVVAIEKVAVHLLMIPCNDFENAARHRDESFDRHPLSPDVCDNLRQSCNEAAISVVSISNDN